MIAVALVEGIGDHGSVLGEVVTVTGDEGGTRHESIVAAEINNKLIMKPLEKINCKIA